MLKCADLGNVVRPLEVAVLLVQAAASEHLLPGTASMIEIWRDRPRLVEKDML